MDKQRELFLARIQRISKHKRATPTRSWPNLHPRTKTFTNTKITKGNTLKRTFFLSLSDDVATEIVSSKRRGGLRRARLRDDRNAYSRTCRSSRPPTSRDRSVGVRTSARHAATKSLLVSTRKGCRPRSWPSRGSRCTLWTTPGVRPELEM